MIVHETGHQHCGQCSQPAAVEARGNLEEFMSASQDVWQTQPQYHLQLGMLCSSVHNIIWPMCDHPSIFYTTGAKVIVWNIAGIDQSCEA